MKLRDLLSVMKPYGVIMVSDNHSYELFYGEVKNAFAVVKTRYMDATVCSVQPEYAHGWGKTGIAIIIEPANRAEGAEHE